MLLSMGCSYAVRASLFLSAQPHSTFVPIRAVAEELSASSTFLSKTLQRLTAEGVIESLRGPKGGVRLSDKGRQDTVFDIVLAIDGPDFFNRCVLGLQGCGEADPCPLHEHWVGLRTSIQEMFESSTLEEIGREFLEKPTRLANLLSRKDVF